MVNPFADKNHQIDYGLFGKDIPLKHTQKKKSPMFPLKASANDFNYIQIPGEDVGIAMNAAKMYKGLTWEETHLKLHEQGLFMPTPSLFMKHYKNVIAAHNGKSELCDLAGRPLLKNDSTDLYHNLVDGGLEGQVSWLNAKFSIVNINPFRDDRHVREGSVDDNKVILGEKQYLAKRHIPLTDGLVDLDFDKTGLPKRMSESEKYKPGENIFYVPPQHDAVARFGVVPTTNIPFLWYNLKPSDTDKRLGVFACVRGTR